jgi:hypothetical protein
MPEDREFVADYDPEENATVVFAESGGRYVELHFISALGPQPCRIERGMTGPTIERLRAGWRGTGATDCTLLDARDNASVEDIIEALRWMIEKT